MSAGAKKGFKAFETGTLGESGAPRQPSDRFVRRGFRKGPTRACSPTISSSYQPGIVVTVVPAHRPPARA